LSHRLLSSAKEVSRQILLHWDADIDHMLFDSEIKKTLEKEIKCYDHVFIKLLNEYDYIFATLTMKHFLVFKKKLKVVHNNWQSMFLDQYCKNKINKIDYNKFLQLKCSLISKINCRLQSYATNSVRSDNENLRSLSLYISADDDFCMKIIKDEWEVCFYDKWLSIKFKSSFWLNVKFIKLMQSRSWFCLILTWMKNLIWRRIHQIKMRMSLEVEHTSLKFWISEMWIVW